MMFDTKGIWLLALGLLLLGLGPSATAAEQAAAHYTRKGADTCIRCHDQDSKFPVFSIFKTKHASTTDPRSPFAQLQCETCHGPGSNHARRLRLDEKRPYIRDFGPRSKTPVSEQNAVCLRCHENKARVGWQGSPHARNDVACADCHRIHAAHDPVFRPATQTQVCVSCHPRIRAALYEQSSHPLRDGKMSCTDCHQPHNSSNDHLLKGQSPNEVCYDCHAEKRGPFLWEHAPVAEDCTQCHKPHGSIQPALLTLRPPLLCQQCHSPADHPSFAQDATGLPSGMPSGFLLANSCLNCHSQIHGSNSPSGARLMR